MKKIFTLFAMCFAFVALNAQNATIVLDNTADVWGDGTGYQMLLDKDTTMLDDDTWALTCGDAAYSCGQDYTIPANATPNDEVAIVGTSQSIEIPAGWYDYMILNPSCGTYSKIYIPSPSIDSPYNRVMFEAGKTYTFTMSLFGTGDAVTISVSGTGVAENEASFGIYPNPANDVLNVKANDVKNIEILNMLGQTVITTNVNAINVANLTNGVYFVRVNFNNGEVSTQKFVKE